MWVCLLLGQGNWAKIQAGIYLLGFEVTGMQSIDVIIYRPLSVLTGCGASLSFHELCRTHLWDVFYTMCSTQCVLHGCGASLSFHELRVVDICSDRRERERGEGGRVEGKEEMSSAFTRNRVSGLIECERGVGWGRKRAGAGALARKKDRKCT